MEHLDGASEKLLYRERIRRMQKRSLYRKRIRRVQERKRYRENVRNNIEKYIGKARRQNSGAFVYPKVCKRKMSMVAFSVLR